MSDLGEWRLFLIFPSRWQSASHTFFSTCFISNFHLYPFDDSSSRLYLYTTLTMLFPSSSLVSPFCSICYLDGFGWGDESLPENRGPKKNNLLAERVDIVTPWVILIRRQRTLYCISTGLVIGLGPTIFLCATRP